MGGPDALEGAVEAAIRRGRRVEGGELGEYLLAVARWAEWGAEGDGSVSWGAIRPSVILHVECGWAGVRGFYRLPSLWRRTAHIVSVSCCEHGGS